MHHGSGLCLCLTSSQAFGKREPTGFSEQRNIALARRRRASSSEVARACGGRSRHSSSSERSADRRTDGLRVTGGLTFAPPPSSLATARPPAILRVISAAVQTSFASQAFARLNGRVNREGCLEGATSSPRSHQIRARSNRDPACERQRFFSTLRFADRQVQQCRPVLTITPTFSSTSS